MNFTPLKCRLLSFLTRGKGHRELCDKQWVLCPPERTIVPPALYLEADLAKITGVMEDTNLDREMNRVRGGEIVHAGTRAFSLRDVELIDGHLYKGPMKHPLVRGRQKLVVPDLTETIREAGLACTLYGSIYFGHWITEDLTLHLAVEGLGRPVIAARQIYPHEPDYRRLFTIPSDAVNRVRLERLVMLDDVGQNRFKRERYLTLRARLRAGAGASASGGHRIFIRRGSKGVVRALMNAAEIEAFMQAQGFVVIDPDRLSVDEIVKQVGGARLVVGIEGSHMIHGIFSMAGDGTMCVLQPPYRFNNVFKDYTDCLGMRYAFVIGRATEGGFVVPLDDLRRVLDRIDSAPVS